MKINDILLAKNAITKLNTVKFNNFKLVMQVYNLTKNVNEVLTMVDSEQTKIIGLYVKKDTNNKPVIVNNQYQFDNQEQMSKYIQEIEKLKNTDIDTITKISIPVDAIQHADDLTGADMLALEQFVEWL